MAMQPTGMGSSVLRNPFSTARQDGPTFNDPGKRAPIENNNNNNNGGQGGDGSITDLSNNDGFEAPGGNNTGGNGDDPMMQFDKLWEDTPTDPKNPPKEFKGYLPEIDPNKFKENLGKLDFSKNVNPDVIKKIVAGGEEALSAFPELINSLGRQVFEMSFNANTKMTQHGLSSVEQRFVNDLIPNSIQNRLVDDTLLSDNQLAADPKYAPLYASVKAQFTKKFPKASPQQISTATAAYMKDFVAKASGVNKPVEDDNQAKLRKGAGDADWENWLNP